MNIKINKADAMIALADHLEAHRKELAEANLVWKQKLRDSFSAALGSLIENGNPSFKEIQSLIKSPPVNNVLEYNKHLNMLSMACDSYIDVNYQEYHRIFSDEWDWRAYGKQLNQSYIN